MEPGPAASPPTAWVTPRGGRILVTVGLVIKLVLLVWNASAYNNKPYDYHWHKARAASAGLRAGKMSYNPPLYYLPCLPLVEDIQRSTLKDGVTQDDLIDLLRGTNPIYLGLFYLCWIGFIIPRLIRDWKSRTVASLVLLGLPGFHKLGAMSHPDNLVVGLSALGISYWLWFRSRLARAGPRDWIGVVGFGLIVGLVGLTRPFAVVPVFVLTLGGVLALLRERGLWTWAFLSRATIFVVLAGSLSLSWYVYRWTETGTFAAGYNERWVGKFRPYRDDLDRVHYFTSFYFGDLLQEPNMLNPKIGYTGKPHAASDMSNSFPTIAYSEFWGDHWLYFSSSKYRTEGKRWPKRILFIVALLMLPLLSVRFVCGCGTIVRRFARGDPDADADALLVLYVLLAATLFFYWLTGDALLPGANTPIKFIYNAHIVPVFVAVAFIGGMGARQFNAWLSYAALVYVAALPIAMFWPH